LKILHLCLKSDNKLLKLIYLYPEKNSEDKISYILLKRRKNKRV